MNLNLFEFTHSAKLPSNHGEVCTPGLYNRDCYNDSGRGANAERNIYINYDVEKIIKSQKSRERI